MKQFQWTKEQASEVIAEYKSSTAYFDRTISQNELYETLRYNCQFGEAETHVLIAALIKAGAKFK